MHDRGWSHKLALFAVYLGVEIKLTIHSVVVTLNLNWNHNGPCTMAAIELETNPWLCRAYDPSIHLVSATIGASFTYFLRELRASDVWLQIGIHKRSKWINCDLCLMDTKQCCRFTRSYLAFWCLVVCGKIACLRKFGQISVVNDRTT